MSERQEAAMNPKEVAELKNEKGRKLINLSVNLNTRIETTSASMDFKMQMKSEQNYPVPEKMATPQWYIYVHQQQNNQQ